MNIRAFLSSAKPETADVKTFDFVFLEDIDSLMPYKAGQFGEIGVEAEELMKYTERMKADVAKLKGYAAQLYGKKDTELTEEDLRNAGAECEKAIEKYKDKMGKKVYGRYAIAAPSTRGPLITIEKQGILTRYIHDADVGQEFDFRINNEKMGFVYEGNDDYFGIAAGSGITIIMCHLRYIVDKKLPVKATVIYSAKTEDEIIFRKELDEIAEKNENIKVVYTVTRDKNWKGYAKRVDEEMVKAEVPGYADRSCYICGGEKFMTATADLMGKMGVKKVSWAL